MPTQENQLTWLRLGLGYIGLVTMQDHHRQALWDLLAGGHQWVEPPYVAQREAGQKPEQRTLYQGLAHTVVLRHPEDATCNWPVQHSYVHSSALSSREATHRQNEMQAIESQLQRIGGLVNKYDHKTPEIIVQQVQKKAFKKRRAQKYLTIEVVHHPDQPATPLQLRCTVDREQVSRTPNWMGYIYRWPAGRPPPSQRQKSWPSGRANIRWRTVFAS